MKGPRMDTDSHGLLLSGNSVDAARLDDLEVTRTFGVNPIRETRGKRRSYRSMIIPSIGSVQCFKIGLPVKRRRALLASNPIEE